MQVTKQKILLRKQKEDINAAGKDLKSEANKVGKDIKSGAQDVSKDVKDAAAKGAQKVEEGAKNLKKILKNKYLIDFPDENQGFS